MAKPISHPHAAVVKPWMQQDTSADSVFFDPHKAAVKQAINELASFYGPRRAQLKEPK